MDCILPTCKYGAGLTNLEICTYDYRQVIIVPEVYISYVVADKKGSQDYEIPSGLWVCHPLITMKRLHMKMLEFLMKLLY